MLFYSSILKRHHSFYSIENMVGVCPCVCVCVLKSENKTQNGEKIRMRSLKLPLLPTHLHTFLISFIKWTIAGRTNRKKIASCIEYEAIFSLITVTIFKLLKILSGISPSILIWIHRLENYTRCLHDVKWKTTTVCKSSNETWQWQL